MSAPVSHPPQRYIWFDRAGQRFAAPLDELQEVLPAPPLRPLPAAEPSLVGLINLRGRILPVFDPASFASSENPKPPSTTVVLVLGGSGPTGLGLLAERVGKMIELPGCRPFSGTARLPVAFAGECQLPGQSRVLIVDPRALALAFGLATPVVA